MFARYAIFTASYYCTRHNIGISEYQISNVCTNLAIILPNKSSHIFHINMYLKTCTRAREREEGQTTPGEETWKLTSGSQDTLGTNWMAQDRKLWRSVVGRRGDGQM